MKKVLCTILSIVMLFSVTVTNLAVNAATSNAAATSITKIQSAAKGFKVTYKRKSGIKGYQIQYSTSAKFNSTNAKIKTVIGYKNISATIDELKGCNVKYYVRVRTYKVINGKKLYSLWSKAKTVKTSEHNYSKATCIKPETCKYCGKESGKKLGHKYTNACDTTCNLCKAKRTITHKYKAATCTEPKTCSVCGMTSRENLGHKYTNDCDTTCDRCNAKRTITHKYKAATCTEPKTCSVCGNTSGEKLGHKYTNDCDTTCNRCTEVRTITHKYKAATCTEPKTCSVCGMTSGEALGHNLKNNVCTKCSTKALDIISELTTYDLSPSIKEAASLMKTTELNDISNADYVEDTTLTTKAIKSLRKVTDERIKEIRQTPNPTIPSGAVVYYVSNNGNDKNDGLTPQTAWATLSKASSVSGNSRTKTYVLFERGGLWRGQLTTAKYVTYSSYGEGDKPKIYASPFNAGGSENSSKWVQSSRNIWTITSSQLTNDVGALIFDDSSYATKKLKKSEVKSDLQFYHDYTNGIIYLYSTSNPATRFKSIEFNVGINIISAKGYVTIDNLCIKFGGKHGVASGSTYELTVKNCEFGWIGGSLQNPGQSDTRLGNAVEVYGYCGDFTVIDNYIYQIYDAGITQQITLNDNTLRKQERVLYSGNVIENCNYSIEYWITSTDENLSYIDTFLIEDNLMWYAGYGLCETRPDKVNACHINGWRWYNRNRAKNYVIRDNVMIDSLDQIFNIYTTQKNDDGSDSMPVLYNNIIFNKQGGKFGVLNQGVNGDTSWPSTVNFTKSLFSSVANVFNGDILGVIDTKLYNNGALKIEY